MARLLLVDDEPDLVKLVSGWLVALGHTVEVALDGQEAIDQVKNKKPDLIILDLMLPKLDGFKVCRLLKFDQRYKMVPILILTARAQEDDKRLACECGADGYLTKPFDNETFSSLLAQLLGFSSN